MTKDQQELGLTDEQLAERTAIATALANGKTAPTRKPRSDKGKKKPAKVAACPESDFVKQVDEILRLDAIRTEKRQDAEEHDAITRELWRVFNRAEADYFNAVTDLRAQLAKQ
jgi:hypothetical protein